MSDERFLDPVQGWRLDLFTSATAREAVRCFDAPFLSYIEQETYCRALQITRELVFMAAPSPLGEGWHLSDDLHTKLRAVLRDIESERIAFARENSFAYVSYPLERDRMAAVVSFSTGDGI